MSTKHALAAGAASLLISVFAGAAPRISQILPQTQIPDRPPVTVDLFGNAKPDIFFNSSPAQGKIEDNAIFIRNLGDRTFDQPRFANFRFSTSGFTDGASSLVTPGQFAGEALFFNEVSQSDQTSVSTPTLIRLDALGRIQPRTALAPPTQGSWIPVDLDGNGVSEFLESVINGGEEAELHIHTGGADGIYTTTVIPMDSSFSIRKAAAIDLDGDADLDLAIYPELGNPGLTILERTGELGFSPAARFIGDASPDSSLADLDGDGLPDIHSPAGALFDYKINLGGLEFGTRKFPALPQDTQINGEFVGSVQQSPAAAALRFSTFGDSAINLVTFRFGTWEILDERAVSTALLDSSSPDPEIVALEDFDADGMDDALVVSSSRLLRRGQNLNTRRLSIAWGNGAGFLPATFIHPSPVSTLIHVTGNFDAYQGDDIIIGPDTNENFAFLTNTGEATFPLIRMITEIRQPTGAPEGTIIAQLHAGDIDGDGITDLAIDYEKHVSGEGYRTACGIAQGNGDGTFQTPILSANAFGIIAQSPCGIDQLIDWDGDGDLDAIGQGRWRENLGGMFDGTTRFLIGGADSTDLFGNPVKQIITHAGDLDGDGSPDIASFIHSIETITPTTLGGSGFVSKMAVAFNDGSGGIANVVEIPASLSGTDIFGNPVASYAAFTDMNSDGLPDLVTSELNSTDLFGNVVADNFWRRNPGGGSRDPASWVKLPFDAVAAPTGPLKDFDGDGVLEWVSPSGFLRPDPRGPISSPIYNFISPAHLNTSGFLLTGDFDGDNDTDFLHSVEGMNLMLVRNTLVDERSGITRRLIALGAKGAFAGPGKDADGDGRSNLEEIVGRTDPRVTDEPLAEALSYAVAQRFTPLSIFLPAVSGTPFTGSRPHLLSIHFETHPLPLLPQQAPQPHGRRNIPESPRDRSGFRRSRPGCGNSVVSRAGGMGRCHFCHGEGSQATAERKVPEMPRGETDHRLGHTRQIRLHG